MKPVANRFYLFVALFIGALYALTIFEIGFILGNNSYWSEPFGDRITYMIGARYFAHDSWLK